MRLSLAPPGGNGLPATVTDLTYQGADTRLALETPGGLPLRLTVSTAALPAGLAPGAAVWVGWPETHGVFL
jgi:putative spermidine/putrescine transport system ATP-binding protein